MAGRPFFGEGLIAASKRGLPAIVATHHSEIDLGVAAQLGPAEVLSLILNNNLLEKMVFLVDVLLIHRLHVLAALRTANLLRALDV